LAPKIVIAVVVVLAAVFVKAKVTGASPDTAAVTLYVPILLFAVRMGDVAIPDELVVAVAVVLPPKLALAPLEGAMNVTEIPASGFDEALVTRACSGLANAVPAVVLCGVPETV